MHVNAQCLLRKFNVVGIIYAQGCYDFKRNWLVTDNTFQDRTAFEHPLPGRGWWKNYLEIIVHIIAAPVELLVGNDAFETQRTEASATGEGQGEVAAHISFE